MKNIFSVKTPGGQWWHGEFSVRYDLFTAAKLLLGLVIVPFLLLFYVGKGLYLGAVWLFKRLKPLGSAIALRAAALWFGLCRICKRKPKTEPASETAETPSPERETPEHGRSDRWMWWLLLLSLLVALIGTWRSCSSAEDEGEGEPMVVYDRAFDEVIVARAYLDGVQEKVSDDCPRALVGFKFINDRPVRDFDFEGMTYDQAVDVVARDWKPLVVGHLNPEVVLSKQQMAVVTLAAMRMGKAGFVRSTFLQKVNEGDLVPANGCCCKRPTVRFIRPVTSRNSIFTFCSCFGTGIWQSTNCSIFRCSRIRGLTSALFIRSTANTFIRRKSETD